MRNNEGVSTKSLDHEDTLSRWRVNKLRTCYLNSLLTGTGSACINYAVWRTPHIVGASSITLASHELGHALIAKAHGAQPSAPIFIPLGVVTLGITQIRGMPKNGSHRSNVYLAGPVAGFSTSCMVLFSLLYSPWLVLGLVFTASEVYSYFLGSDAKKAKKARVHASS